MNLFHNIIFILTKLSLLNLADKKLGFFLLVKEKEILVSSYDTQKIHNTLFTSDGMSCLLGTISTYEFLPVVIISYVQSWNLDISLLTSIYIWV